VTKSTWLLEVEPPGLSCQGVSSPVELWPHSGKCETSFLSWLLWFFFTGTYSKGHSLVSASLSSLIFCVQEVSLTLASLPSLWFVYSLSKITFIYRPRHGHLALGHGDPSCQGFWRSLLSWHTNWGPKLQLLWGTLQGEGSECH
jgi:hypothetical protein